MEDLHPVLAAYDERQERLGLATATRDQYRLTARQYQAWCASQGLDVAQVASWQLEEYLTGSGLAASTQRVRYAWIRAAYRYASRKGIEVSDPCVDVRLPRPPDTQPRVVPSGELRSMKHACVTDEQYLLFHVLAYTGMRRFECSQLVWDDVNLEAQTISVIGKGQKARLVPVHPALSEVLEGFPHQAGRPVLAGKNGGAGLTTLERRLASFCGSYAFHDFRRTVATSLAINQVPIPVVDRIMGWAPRGMLARRYFGVAEPKLHEAILHLYRDDPV